MKRWLGLVLLLPGGLILAAGLGLAWAGLVLLIPGLRRLSTAWPSAQDVGAAAVVPPQAGQSSPVGTPVTGSAPQPYGEPHEPSQRVPWAACGERGSSTGEPPVWLAPLSREVH
jgi:hypothetical protein